MIKKLLLLKCLTVAVCLGIHAEDIPIGLTASISGNWAELGQETVNGTVLAVELVNQSGGVLGRKLRLVMEDSNEADSPARLITAYRSLRNRGVQLFIGPNGTPGALALIPILEHDDVLMVAPCIGVESGVSSLRENLFNIQGGLEVATQFIADEMNRLSMRRIAVVSSTHPFEATQAQVFVKQVELNGGKIAASTVLASESVDMQSQLLSILQSNPNSVFLALYNQLPEVSKRLRSLGYRGPLYTIQVDRSRLRNAAGAIEGVRAARLSNSTNDFKRSYLERFKKFPEYPADYAYDAVMVLVEGIKGSSSTDPTLVARHVRLQTFSGASGEFSFGESGHARRKPSLICVKDEEVLPIARCSK